jgi:hypothetical protein
MHTFKEETKECRWAPVNCQQQFGGIIRKYPKPNLQPGRVVCFLPNSRRPVVNREEKGKDTHNHLQLEAGQHSSDNNPVQNFCLTCFLVKINKTLAKKQVLSVNELGRKMEEAM